MVVLDSSYLIAYHNEGDAHHAAAAAVFDRLLTGEWGDLLLPEYVFLEVTTVLAARLDLDRAAEIGSILLEAREVTFVPCSAFFLEAFDIFRARTEPGLSFTDAAIVAIARHHGAHTVATFDREFRNVKGLSVLPKGEEG